MSTRELLSFPPFWLAVGLWLWLVVSCVVRPLWMRHEAHANAEEVNAAEQAGPVRGRTSAVRQPSAASTSSVSVWQTDKRGTA